MLIKVLFLFVNSYLSNVFCDVCFHVNTIRTSPGVSVGVSLLLYVRGVFVLLFSLASSLRSLSLISCRFNVLL